MKALILNNIVVELNPTGFPVAAPLHWVDCDSVVQLGDIFDGSVFSSAPASPIPEEIPVLNARQIRRVLTQAGLRASVESFVASADQDTKDWWEYTTEFWWDYPVLVAAADQLGITEVQRKQLFKQGSTL